MRIPARHSERSEESLLAFVLRFFPRMERIA
jgi:hypothetical protein